MFYKGYLVSYNQLNRFVTVFDGDIVNNYANRKIVATFENVDGGNEDMACRFIDNIIEGIIEA